MAELGSNPARIIPAWRGFLEECHTPNGPARGLGEPIWPGRRPEEIEEAQLHEALLNAAVDPDTPFWLLCPYDAARLDDTVLEEVHRSHPVVLDDHAYRGSHLYGGRDHVTDFFGRELPSLSDAVEEMAVTRSELAGVSSFVAIKAYAAGLAADRAAGLAVAAQELVTSSWQRGATSVTVSLWVRPDAVVCEVRDPVRIGDPMTGRRAGTKEQRKGVWVANQLGDLVQLRSTPDGTLVRVHSWL